MRLALGITPIRPVCPSCGGSTMYAGRQADPSRGLPWELQTFVCTHCSVVTVRHPGGDTATAAGLLPVTTWSDDYGTHSAEIDGLPYRIVAYPQGSPLAGKYGCYSGGRYTGLKSNLMEAKAWCRSLSVTSAHASAPSA